MNPELLKSFLAVARNLNFTKAADQLTVTQPAVSRQIRQLEHELGVVLFERLGRSVALTDGGRALVPQAEQLLGQIDRVVEGIQEYRSADRGRLRIGASTTPGYYLLPPILERGSATRQLFERWMNKASVSLQETIELSSPEAIKALVRAGVGISFMSIYALKEDLRRGHLARLKVSGLRLTRPIYAVRHPDKHMSPAIRNFLALLPNARR